MTTPRCPEKSISLGVVDADVGRLPWRPLRSRCSRLLVLACGAAAASAGSLAWVQVLGSGVAELKPSRTQFARHQPSSNTRVINGGKSKLPRHSLLALYPARVKYPPRAWTAFFLAVVFLIVLWQLLLPIGILPNLVTSKLPALRKGSLLATAQAIMCFPLQQGNGLLGVSSVFLLTLLLGRQVEACMGGRTLAGSYILAGVVTVAASRLFSTSSIGLWHVAALWAVFGMFTLTSRSLAVVALVNDEPSKGCTTVGFWVNRWRLVKILVIGHFMLALTLSPMGFGMAAEFEALLVAGTFATLIPWACWKKFVDGRKKKIDIRKEGKNALNFADGWLEEQEDRLDFTLKMAATAADVTENVPKQKTDKASGKDVKDILQFVDQGLQWFKGTRKFIREKLDDGLEALTSDSDENLPVAGTTCLIILQIAFFLAALYRGTLAPHGRAAILGSAWLGQTALMALQLPSWLSLGGSLFLLVIVGRAVEVLGGSHALACGYFSGAVAAELLCRSQGAAWHLGIAAGGACFSLLVMALSWTAGPSIKIRRENLTSFRKLRRSVGRVDWRRLVEAGLLVLFGLSWAHSLSLQSPNDVGPVDFLRRTLTRTAPASAAHSLPSFAIVSCGGLAGAIASRTLILPLLGLAFKALRPVARRFAWVPRRIRKLLRAGDARTKSKPRTQ